MWILVFASGEIQRASEPQADRFGVGMWLVFGLPLAFIYCGIAYGVRQIILFARARWGGLDVARIKYKS